MSNAPESYGKLVVASEQLAIDRESMVAAGADPADLLIPMPLRTTPVWEPSMGGPVYPVIYTPAEVEAHNWQVERDRHRRALARVWVVVAASMLAAFAGSVSAAGAILMVQDDLTWHGIVPMVVAVFYLCGAGGAAGHARNLYRRASEHDGGDDD